MKNIFTRFLAFFIDKCFVSYDMEVRYIHNEFDKKKSYQKYYDVCLIVKHIQNKYKGRIQHIKVIGKTKEGLSITLYNKIYKK